MNRRGKRLAFTVAAAGLVVVLGLAIAHWKTILEHVEAWRFQLTRETVTITPAPGGFSPIQDDLAVCLRVLATDSGLPVIHDTALDRFVALVARYPPGPAIRSCLTKDEALRHLRSKGWRVIEQRFPRRAYVVMDPAAR